MVAAAGLLFAFAGVAIRMAGATLSSIEILFWRNAISMLILTPWVLSRWPESIRPVHAGLMVMRGATVVVSLICYYYAVTIIPLAEAVLLNFSAPIFVPILGFLLFRFPFNRTVLIAVAIGFVGAALILKPGTDLFRPAALIGLAAGVLGGLAIVAVWRHCSQLHRTTRRQVSMTSSMSGSTMLQSLIRMRRESLAISSTESC